MAVGSFSAGLSGLNANSTYLSVIGNNLANINTIGFKSSTVSFMDLVSQNVGGSSINPMQVGLGVVTGSISPVFSQGSIENTREATNVAIQGNGFFVVKDPNSGGLAYTRAGNFSFNSDGVLVSPDGFRVQGFTQIDPLTQEIITTGQAGDITVPPGVLREPVATTNFSTRTNLNSNAVAGDVFTTAVQIYDALGSAHMVTVTYTKDAAPGAWTYEMTVPGEDIVGGTAGTPQAIFTGGTVQFDANGKLQTLNGGAPADVAITTAAWTNGAAASVLNWDVLDANNVTSLTGFDSASATSSINQNGSAAGMITSISIDSAGQIIATFGAGQTIPVGALALASFNNPKGLVKLGSNRYGESQAAGVANIGTAGTGGRGTLIGSAIEQSNVDIATEFTQMILAQRGYQANAKTITVSDEVLVDTLQLKR
ncbi:MAG: flagellar hook protein FlgE [Acidobacteria bacterium]|jgi:flagellar hook protein FlgE|nr:flagellar hook protein FlgE [Acidobacteriota bacterium]